MIKRNIVIFLLVCCIIALIILNFSNNKMVVYSMDVYNNELRLENFTLVYSSSNCYIADFYIERIWEDKEIRNVSFEVTADGKVLTDSAFQFDHATTVGPKGNILIKGIKITKDSTLTFKFKYKVDGVEKEFYENVELKKHIRYQ